ncbi:MAG TPA: glycosyltransferase, partial [Polyangia bacterium]|nr:glycosyltransferase [Polyangia bacterium]
HDAGALSPELAARTFHDSFVHRWARWLPRRGPGFRVFLPLFPAAIESFSLDGYDLVVSSSHAVAKGAIAATGALHVSYVHSPMRYVWEASAAYARSVPGGAAGRAGFALMAHYLRLWDTASTARVDVLVANSAYTRERIRRSYGRDATVIEPPVDTARFARVPALAPDGGEPLYLCVSALVPYKQVDLAVRAFAARQRPGRLVVVGDGPERARLEALGGGRVTLRGRVDDDELLRLYGAARAVIHPALDDFGIVPREALAAGRPVVTFAQGGAADAAEGVEGGATGVQFHEPTPESLAAAVDRLEATPFDPARLRAAARRFDRATFEERFAMLVEAELRRRRDVSARRGP